MIREAVSEWGKDLKFPARVENAGSTSLELKSVAGRPPWI